MRVRAVLWGVLVVWKGCGGVLTVRVGRGVGKGACDLGITREVGGDYTRGCMRGCMSSGSHSHTHPLPEPTNPKPTPNQSKTKPNQQARTMSTCWSPAGAPQASPPSRHPRRASLR